MEKLCGFCFFVSTGNIHDFADCKINGTLELARYMDILQNTTITVYF